MEEKNIEVKTDSNSKNKAFDFHKVFAALGIVLTISILILAGVWYLVEGKNTQYFDDEEDTVKISTSSAKTSTKSSEKNKTADWETYTSSQLAFSIKYPEELKNIKEQLSTANSQIPTISFSDNPDFNSIDPKIATVNVSKGDFKAAYDAISLLEVNKLYSRSVAGATDVAEETRLADITIGNQVGIKQSYTPSVKGEGQIDYATYIYVNKDSDYYKLSIISGTKASYEKNQAIFNLMITTFKFLD